MTCFQADAARAVSHPDCGHGTALPFRQPLVVPGIVVGVISIRDQLERPVKFFPVPDGAGIDPLGRRHAPVANQGDRRAWARPRYRPRPRSAREPRGAKRGRPGWRGAWAWGAMGSGFRVSRGCRKGRKRTKPRTGGGRPCGRGGRQAGRRVWGKVGAFFSGIVA